MLSRILPRRFPGRAKRVANDAACPCICSALGLDGARRSRKGAQAPYLRSSPCLFAARAGPHFSLDAISSVGHPWPLRIDRHHVRCDFELAVTVAGGCEECGRRQAWPCRGRPDCSSEHRRCHQVPPQRRGAAHSAQRIVMRQTNAEWRLRDIDPQIPKTESGSALRS